MDKIRYTVLISHPSDVDEKTLDFIYQCFDMWNEQNQALPFEFYPFEWDKDVATLSEVANGQDVITVLLKHIVTLSWRFSINV